jgi:hypothetical protein
MLGIVPLSRFPNKDLKSLLCQTRHPIVASVPTHSLVSEDSCPTVLGIVPIS